MVRSWYLMNANHAPDVDKQLISIISVSPHNNSLCTRAKGSG